MQSADQSSQEKLDQLLRDGTITEYEYLQLSRALEKKPEGREKQSVKAASGRKLRKSWKHRLIGGVCGGIADYFEIDPTIIRVIAIILALMAAPGVVIVYLALYFMLPWDDEAAAREPEQWGHPWWFAIWGTFFLTVLPLLLSKFLVPRVASFYAQLSAPLPVISRMAFQIGGSYLNLGAVFLSIIIVAMASLLYLICHNQKLRFVYSILFYFFAVSWSLLLIAGACLPLLPFSETIR